MTFLLIGTGEALHHVPGLEAVNAFGVEHMPLQAGLLLLGILAYLVLTAWSYRCACRNFERIDL